MSGLRQIEERTAAGGPELEPEDRVDTVDYGNFGSDDFVAFGGDDMDGVMLQGNWMEEGFIDPTTFSLR